MTREKEQDNNFVEGKKGLYLVKEIKKRRKEELLQKEVFSADLTIAFVLITVHSVSCSLVAGPYKFKGLKRGILGPYVRRVSHGITVLVCRAPHGLVDCFVSGQDQLV